jgi:hypothetical protein
MQNIRLGEELTLNMQETYISRLKMDLRQIYPCNIFLSYNQLIIDFTMCLHLQSQISVYLHVANFKLLIMIKIVTKNTFINFIDRTNLENIHLCIKKKPP